MRHLRLVAATLLALVTAHGAWAANCSSNPFTLANGQTADATQVMSNFNNLLNCANNNLAHNGANSDITSLAALSTPLSVAQGGTGAATLSANALLVGAGTAAFTTIAPQTAGNILVSNGTLWQSIVSTAGTLNSITNSTNGGLLIVNPTTSAVISMSPRNLLVKTVPLSADSIILMDSAAGNVAKTGVVSTFPGFRKPGTQAVLNPYATATTVTQAHGLGAMPTELVWYLENITPEFGYLAGDRIFLNVFGDANVGSNSGFTVSANATNVIIQTVSGNTFEIARRDTTNAGIITAANWKLVVIPYLQN